MRIAQVVLSLDIGGQERLVVRLAKALRDRGHHSHVITLKAGGALRGELGSIPVHEVERRDGFDPSLYPKLWRLFRSLRPDVVHTHNPAPLVYAVPAARLARVPRVVHTKHGDFRFPPHMLRLARLASPFVHEFVAVSEDTSIAAKRNERPRAQALSVIENGIPLSAFELSDQRDELRRSVRAALGIPQDAFVVGSVGRLVVEKDYPLLVRAMSPLLDAKMHLVIVGEGTARREIEAAIESDVEAPKRPFAILTGARHDVPHVLCAFDIFVSSSRTEGLPLALPEAMTSGLPIVATAVGGVPGIVPAEVGVLVPPGEAALLRAAIERLARDPALRARMGTAGREYATRRFAEERMVSEYVARYSRS